VVIEEEMRRDAVDGLADAHVTRVVGTVRADASGDSSSSKQFDPVLVHGGQT